MAAGSLEPAATALLAVHPASSSGLSKQRNVPPKQLLFGKCKFLKGSSLAAKPGGQRQYDPQDLSLSCDRNGTEQSQGLQLELLWQQYFVEPAQWWDNRRNVSSPHFRHKLSKEVLWLKSHLKPAWVDEKLASLDSQTPTFSSILTNNPVSSFQRSVTGETVSTLCEKGQLGEAVDALGILVQTESRLSRNLFYDLVKRCVAERNLVLGRRVDELAVQGGYQSNTFLANHVLRMYASHGRLQEAANVFTRVAAPDVFMWFSIISAHAERGEPKTAIEFYHRMRNSALKPNGHVFAAVLKACASATDFESGTQVHADLLASGLEPDVFVGSGLVDMYVKCGKLEHARRAFDSLPTRNVVTWTAMISGYAEHGQGQEALALHARMEHEGISVADRVTLLCLLKACANTNALARGKQLHADILKRGLGGDITIGNCLVDMYAKCGSLEDACRVFNNLRPRNVVTWNAMIAGYTQHEMNQEALALYTKMQEEGIMVADKVTFVCLLKACARVEGLQQGIQLHEQIVERGLGDDMVVGSCLVDMYAKCGRVEEARKVFDGLPTKDVVTWTAMIAGYADHGLGLEALELHARMEQEDLISANVFTFACLLKACTTVGAIDKAKQLHSQIMDRGLGGDIVVGNALVDMYAKCGSLENAVKVFESLPNRDVITWTALINGYGQSNAGQKAIQCFRDMLQEGVRPNETTFTCLLGACAHEGLVSEGRHYFSTMVDNHGIVPTTKHYNCMVDLLGRSGLLAEAEELLLSMPSGGNDVGFTSVLNACKCHGDVDMGMRCFQRLTKLDPTHASAYILMGNIYADAGRWADVERIQSLRKTAGAAKKPAEACIEVKRQVHTFFVGEERGDISSKVRSMYTRLREGGHVPHTELVLKSISEKEKESELCGHAEKLALAYGLLNTPAGTPLLVTKNLRMCGDCHSATEVMSRIERRNIVVRDAHRIHRFMDGSCACGRRP